MSNPQAALNKIVSSNPLDNISIGKKLALISVIFLLPILFLLIIDYAARSNSITIAKSEIKGSELVSIINEAQVALRRSATATADQLNEIAVVNAITPEELKAKTDAMFKAIEVQEGFALDPASVSGLTDKVQEFVETHADLNIEDLVDASIEADETVLALVSKIADASALILDPELVSYYTMDVAVFKLPLVADRLSKVDLQLHVLRSKPTAGAKDRTRLMVLDGEFEVARAGLAKTMTTAFDVDSSGALKAALGADYQAVLDSTGEFNKKLKQSLDNLDLNQGKTADLQDLVAEREAAIAAITTLNQKVSAEFNRELNERIARDRTSLWLNIGMAAVFAGLAFAAAFIVAGGISGSLGRLAETMARLSGGQIDVDVPHRDRGDEVGAMANALQTFKENEVDRVRMAVELPAQQKAALDNEKRLRSLVRNIPGVAIRTLGDAARSVDFVSDNIERITGYSAKEFTGSSTRTLISVVHPEDLAEYKRALADSAAKKQPFSVEYRMMNKDGSPRFIAEKGQPIFDEQGKLAFVDSHFVDRFAAEEEAPVAPAPAPAPAKK